MHALASNMGSRWFLPILAVLMMTVVFFDNDSRSGFQRDSEQLVIGQILADRFSITKTNAGLGTIVVDAGQGQARETDNYLILTMLKNPRTDENWAEGLGKSVAAVSLPSAPEFVDRFQTATQVMLLNGEKRSIVREVVSPAGYVEIYLSGLPIRQNELTTPFQLQVNNGLGNGSEFVPLIRFQPYTSSFGLQGHILAFLYNHAGFSSIKVLRLIMSLLLALVLAMIGNNLKPIVGSGGILVFFLVTIASSWLANFSGNLFWVPFTWFLPLLAASYLSRFPGSKNWVAILLGLLTCAKCLCGYEYISSMLVLAILPIVVLYSSSSDSQERSRLRGAAFWIFAAAIAGFVLAFLVHAELRGASLVEGAAAIWKEDVLRRTLGGAPADFPAVYRDSLVAGPLEVLGLYIFGWRTDVIGYFPGFPWFPILLGTSILATVIGLRRSRDRFIPLAAGLVICFLAPISWFVLAKSHSYIHTHMNFVLWYFGFVQYAILSLVMACKPLVDRYFLTKIKATIHRFWSSL